MSQEVWDMVLSFGVGALIALMGYWGGYYSAEGIMLNRWGKDLQRRVKELEEAKARRIHG